MTVPPIPLNESSRLEALRRYRILDTFPESVYEDLTSLAAHICGVPISLVSLVDADRQWFKSCQGLDATETSRSVSFCGHAVAVGEMLVVRDATLDSRFSDNPLVLADPKIRFYAGAPLITPDGFALGTLCVIDRIPRDPSSVQLNMLQALSRMVISQFELRLAKEVADQASNTKSTFLANMSHELRTPLNSVIGFTNILCKNKSKNMLPRDLEFLGRVKANGEHLLSLINDLLDLSKVESGGLELKRESVDLSKLVRETATLCDDQLAAKNIELLFDVPGDLPAIVADEQRFKQVLLNLLSNAVKFSEGGRILVRAIVGDDGRAARLNVADTGIGIPEDKHQQVFESFKQADDSTSRRFGGTGLGLPISRKLSELMGFRLELASRPDEGSTFSIALVESPPPLVHVPPIS